MPSHEKAIEDIARESISNIDTKSIFEGFWNATPPEFSLIITLTKYLLIAFLVYVIISIIVKLFSLGSGRKLKSIGNNVAQINEKLNLLIEKLQEEEGKKEKKEAKEEKKKERK